MIGDPAAVVRATAARARVLATIDPLDAGPSETYRLLPAYCGQPLEEAWHVSAQPPRPEPSAQAPGLFVLRETYAGEPIGIAVDGTPFVPVSDATVAQVHAQWRWIFRRWSVLR